jgi:CheY-like chemotaxis protein
LVEDNVVNQQIGAEMLKAAGATVDLVSNGREAVERVCESDESASSTVSKVAGFSLHAGVAAKAQQRDKLERLCRRWRRAAIVVYLAGISQLQ